MKIIVCFVSLQIMKVQLLPTEYLEELGYRIRVARTMMKFNQKDFARQLQTAPSQLSKMETGKSAPTLYHLLMIKRLADGNDRLKGELSWAWLLEGDGEILNKINHL